MEKEETKVSYIICFVVAFTILIIMLMLLFAMYIKMFETQQSFDKLLDSIEITKKIGEAEFSKLVEETMSSLPISFD